MLLLHNRTPQLMLKGAAAPLPPESSTGDYADTGEEVQIANYRIGQQAQQAEQQAEQAVQQQQQAAAV